MSCLASFLVDAIGLVLNVSRNHFGSDQLYWFDCGVGALDTEIESCLFSRSCDSLVCGSAALLKRMET